MQQANLNRDGTYFIFHDGQVLANALNTASQQWCAMIHHLRYDRVFRNHPEVAKRYIRSSISYLVTFPMHSVVNTVFKYPTMHAVLASNFHSHAWKKIRVPNDQIVPIAQAQLILGLLKNIVDNPQPDRFLSERIGIDHPVFNQHIKPHISHRKILAAVMSLLPSSYIDKLGEAQWLCILEAVANDLVSAPRSNSCAYFNPSDSVSLAISGGATGLPRALPARNRHRSTGASRDPQEAPAERHGVREAAGEGAGSRLRRRPDQAHSDHGGGVRRD
jgi:hypothetical protein